LIASLVTHGTSVLATHGGSATLHSSSLLTSHWLRSGESSLILERRESSVTEVSLREGEGSLLHGEVSGESTSGPSSESSLGVDEFLSLFLRLVDVDVGSFLGLVQSENGGGLESFFMSSFGISLGFEGNKTELGFLGLAGVGPGLDTNAGNLTEDSEGFLDFSFAEVDSKVLKVKVVQALSAWVASLELTDSISLGLMEVNEEGVGSIKDKVLGVGTFNSLLGLFGSLVTDESSPFSLLFGGLERFDLTKSFEMLLDESFDFSFRESYGEILNVEVSLSSVIGSLGLRDEELNIESFFLKCAFVESFKSSFSFLDLVETDISVFETVAVFVGSQVSRKDRLNIVEVGMEIIDSGVLVNIFNIKVG